VRTKEPSKRTAKTEVEKFQVEGDPGIYDDLVRVLRRASTIGPGAKVYRVNDRVLMAIIPTGKKIVEIE
jgi:hypothetical protein